MGKLIRTLVERLEKHRAFEELVERVMREAEQEYGQPCTISYHCVPEGEVQPLDTTFVVVVGKIKKKRQERIVGGAG